MLNNDPLSRVPSKTLEPIKKTNEKEKDSCLLTMGNSNKNPSLKKNEDNEKDTRKPVFILFGQPQPILTEQQLSESWSGDGSVVLQNGPVETSSDEAGPYSSEQKSEFGLETSHCKELWEKTYVTALRHFSLQERF
nr:auxin response factor 18-like [Tanacetum cinerariifolium]